MATRAISWQEPKSVLVVGDPMMPAFPVGRYSDVTLPQLPGAEREAKSIAALLGTRPLVGEEALEDVVTKTMQEAQVIHFATHGLLVQASVLTTSSLSASMSVDLPPESDRLDPECEEAACGGNPLRHGEVEPSLQRVSCVGKDPHNEPAGRFGYT
jgi:hypothetical protein